MDFGAALAAMRVGDLVTEPTLTDALGPGADGYVAIVGADIVLCDASGAPVAPASLMPAQILSTQWAATPRPHGI